MNLLTLAAAQALVFSVFSSLAVSRASALSSRPDLCSVPYFRAGVQTAPPEFHFSLHPQILAHSSSGRLVFADFHFPPVYCSVCR
jgi:hypothetical protein